jgi:hypothetical protein
MRARDKRPPRRAAEQRDEVAPLIKKTRSHGTTAKRVGSAKRLRSAKDLPFSSSRVGRGPVRNSLDHLVGAGKQRRRDVETIALAALRLIISSNFVGRCTG